VHGPLEPRGLVGFQHLGLGGNTHDRKPDRPVRSRAQFRGPVQDVPAIMVGEPGVAERQYPIQHPRPVPADQDRRMGPLRRLGPGPDPVERDVLARVTLSCPAFFGQEIL